MKNSFYHPGDSDGYSGDSGVSQEPGSKPRFNIALQKGTLVGKPPFEFQKVVLRNFPLRANFRALARFCDKYLNIVPREFAYFRPAMPFVILTVVNYGKMSAVAGNLGWTSQNELLFAIPLERYRRERGRWVFQGLAQMSPFIFVDDEDSQVTGREVYGWPKVQGWYSPGVDQWARHPLNSRHLLSLHANTFEEMFANEVPRPREILSIEEEAPLTFSVVPPQVDNILNPWLSIPKAITGWGSMITTVAEMFTSPAFRGYESIDREGRPELLEGVAENLDLFTRMLHANTINLKQMRDAEDPQTICYQALTNAQMEISQIHRGGMLGDLALLRGDPTGGFRIRLHEYASQPIAEALGLEVADRADGSVPIVTLNPVMPYWQELDLKYLRGENVCWRTNTRAWTNDEAPPNEAPQDQRSGTQDEDREGEEKRAELLYNTMGSNGFEVATGPFSSKASVRVLPLPADKAKLQKLVDEYLNGNDAPYQFEVWGNYVFMLVIANEDISSQTADIGNWARTQVDFAIPLRWFEPGVRGKEGKGNPPKQGKVGADDGEDWDWIELADGRTLVSCGYFCPFSFMDSDIGNRTAREVYGWEARKAQIVRPETTWLDWNGPFNETKPLMEIKLDVLPALNLDQKTDLRTLVQVVAGDLHGEPEREGYGERTWQHIADTWARPRKHELEQMDAYGDETPGPDGEPPNPHFTSLRALSIELLFNRKPFNQISLKQFRDAKDVDSACYQAYVCSETVIDRLSVMKEIEEKMHVVIHRYPTMPIVDLLGLDVKLRMFTDQGEADVLQPMRPFYMKVELKTGAAENVLWRTGENWEPGEELGPGTDHHKFVEAVGRRARYFEGRRDDKTAISAEMVAKIDGGGVVDWEFGAPNGNRNDIPFADIPSTLHSVEWPIHRFLSYRDVIKGVLDREMQPQMAVHAMLSNRWQDPTPPEARGKPKRPNFLMRRDSLGAKQSEAVFPSSGETWDEAYSESYWSPWSRFSAPPMVLRRDQHPARPLLEALKDVPIKFGERMDQLRSAWPTQAPNLRALASALSVDPLIEVARAQKEQYEFELGWIGRSEWHWGKWTDEKYREYEASVERLIRVVRLKEKDYVDRVMEVVTPSDSSVAIDETKLDQESKSHEASLEPLWKLLDALKEFRERNRNLKREYKKGEPEYTPDLKTELENLKGDLEAYVKAQLGETSESSPS